MQEADYCFIHFTTLDSTDNDSNTKANHGKTLFHKGNRSQDTHTRLQITENTNKGTRDSLFFRLTRPEYMESRCPSVYIGFGICHSF